MPDITQMLLQTALAFTSCMLFYIVGRWVCHVSNFADDHEATDSKNWFYVLLSGMVLVVVVYSLIVAAFKSVHFFILIAAFVCLKRKAKVATPFSLSIRWKQVLELLLLVILAVVVFNFLPESEYKQADSFYYLKISEALNLTGQENANAYYNLVSDQYHGVEAYHYFECWLNALLLRFTGSLLPNIQVFRIVTYTIITVIFIYGLFYFWGLMSGSRPGLKAKVVCAAFLFFMPDIYDYLPQGIRHYLVFIFENNLLERPNFRTIWLFLLPVMCSLNNKRPNGRFIFFLVCLSVMNPTAFAMVVPAFVLFVIITKASTGNLKNYRLQNTGVIIFLLFVVMYTAFYSIFSATATPAMYESSWQQLLAFYKASYRFVGLTTLTSLIYIALLLGIAYYIFRRFAAVEYKQYIGKHKTVIYFSIAMILSGIVVSRALSFLENAYQVAFNSYIVTSLLIFAMFIFVARKSWKHNVVVVLLFVSGYVVYKINHSDTLRTNIFVQNGKFRYSGLGYSRSYIEAVSAYAKKHKKIRGAYIADSVYYRDLYYSSRNPNVYHLPITYILAGRTDIDDFCLSDPAAIKYDISGRFVNNHYLNNAIERSYYHRLYKRFDPSDPFVLNQIGQFILNNHLQFLVLTPGIKIDDIPGVHVYENIHDSNTGERFLIFNDYPIP